MAEADLVQVVMSAEHFARYNEWLEAFGLRTFPIPVEDEGGNLTADQSVRERLHDDLPTYAVTPR